MRVCLYEDRRVLDLEPLALTRPAFDLLCGTRTLGQKQARAFASTTSTMLVRPELADVTRLQHPGVAVNELNSREPAVFVNARWLPPAPPALPHAIDRPCVGVVEGEVAYAALGPEQAATLRPGSLDDDLDRLRRVLPVREAGGRMVRYLWELVEQNGSEIALDFWLAAPQLPLSDGAVSLIGPSDRISVHPSARVEPFVVADTTAGPVLIDAGAVVTSFTRLEGPCYVGPGAHVLGAKIRGGTSLGPNCRVGGEVEASVLLGNSNKYHDGFLGHAYVGEWVNLGAGTSNSDLRNDYGDVTVTVRGERVDTGRAKVGCFLGDHAKAGLGTLLNTGTSAGLFSQLLPTGGLLPKHVPSFAGVWNGSLVENGDLGALLRTADKVMRRRGQALTAAHEALYRHAHEQSAAQRRAAIREAEARRLRRSA